MTLQEKQSAKLRSAIDSGNADEVYTVLVEQAGLYGKAFFGHRKSRAETKALAKLWARSRKLVAKDEQPPIVMAPDGEEPADFDNDQPICDICGLGQPREGEDWNGDTGNHLSCETRDRRESYPDIVHGEV